jgi:DNA-binding MarR family transcriptional regulator
VPHEIPPTEMLLIAVSRLHRAQIELLQRLEIPMTLRQYRILEQVSEGHTTLSELSKLVHRSLPTVSESVDGLIRRELLVRRRSPTDRRAAELSLTPQGRTAVGLGGRCLAGIAEDFAASLTKTQRAALAPTMNRMYAYAGDLLGWDPAAPVN